MSISKITILLSIIIIILSCHPYNKNIAIEEAITFNDIRGEWISIDTSIFLYSKIDLKDGGTFSLSIGPGREVTSFIISSVTLKGNIIKLFLKGLDGDEILQFKGKYDSYLDVLILNSDDLDKDILYIREKVFFNMISRLQDNV